MRTHEHIIGQIILRFVQGLVAFAIAGFVYVLVMLMWIAR
jgi:hypothetical protein